MRWIPFWHGSWLWWAITVGGIVVYAIIKAEIEDRQEKREAERRRAAFRARMEAIQRGEHPRMRSAAWREKYEHAKPQSKLAEEADRFDREHGGR